MKERGKSAGNASADADIMKRSFERETETHEQSEGAHEKGERRSLMGAPVDPNSPTTKGNFPPGLPAQDAVDPGRATPGANPVRNESGKKDRH